MLIVNYLKKKDPDNKFVKAWENKRLHALMCLGLWIIFFIFIFLVFIIPYNHESKNVTTHPKESLVTLEDMKEKLISGSYEFKYTVKNDSGATIYSGNKNGDVITGYKEDSSITKYEILNGTVYKLVMDEKVLYDGLYENVNENLLSLEYIFSLEYDKDNMKIEGNTLSYETLNGIVKITSNDKNIEKVEITNENDNYILEFSNIV